MNYIYSATTNSFYPLEMKEDYTQADSWPDDAVEVQLAHANGGSVRGIYNHAQYLDKRREMMQWWADWLDEKGE
ncbi:integrase family domain protein [Escherichia coli 2722950]|nr:integrase family domain protein [Escherichia coli 2722950]